MILHNSWLSHLRDINAADQANRNFNAFINATDVDKQKNDKINAITEDPDSIVLIADNHRRIKFVHSCKKFGGTRINPVVTVGGLVGQGARAFPIAVDLETATSSKNVIIPSLDKIMHCKNIDELELLTVDGKENETEEETTEEASTTPSRRTSTRIREKRAGIADEEASASEAKTDEDEDTTAEENIEYKESAIKIPVPFLAITALTCNSTNPLDIIIATIKAAVAFNDAHMEAEDFNYEDIRPSAENLIKWLFAVHMGLVPETRLAVEPDNDELAHHADERHRLCILPPLNSIPHMTNTAGTSDSVIQQLIEATNRNNEICEETNKVRMKEYEWKKEADEVKKDRTKDLDPSVRQMIENASATEKDQAGELCQDFISLFNSKTHGGFDIKLHQLFENDGMREVVFAEGVATNLWAGLFKRTHKSAPGAFSPFSFSEMKPLSSNDSKDRSLLIDIFSGQKGGLMRNLDDVKASAKMTVSVPQDYHSLAFQLEAYTCASKYIFGETSRLTTQLIFFIDKVRKHSIDYKNRIAVDEDFPAKVLLAIDEQVNMFLDECRSCVDREDVDERFINFDDLHMNILLSRFTMTLPSNFHKKAADTESTQGKENDPNRKTGKGKRKGEGKDDEKNKRGNNKLINADQVPEFMMKEGETWETYQGKCPQKRVKFMGTYLCPRYHTRGTCYKEGCKFAKSHVPANEIPEQQRAEYIQYMACCRNAPSLNE